MWAVTELITSLLLVVTWTLQVRRKADCSRSDVTVANIPATTRSGTILTYGWCSAGISGCRRLFESIRCLGYFKEILLYFQVYCIVSSRFSELIRKEKWHTTNSCWRKFWLIYITMLRFSLWWYLLQFSRCMRVINPGKAYFIIYVLRLIKNNIRKCLNDLRCNHLYQNWRNELISLHTRSDTREISLRNR